MWRSTLLALAFLLLCPLAFSQSTTVSGTITDAGSQAWISGTYSFVFKVSPSNPIGPYFWNGAPFSTAQTIAGVLDPSGSYSVSIPSNTAIVPSGSLWTATFCSLASSKCFTQDFTISGATQTVQPIPPAISVDLISPQPGPQRAYSDTEISNAAIGSIYYNILSTSYRSCIAVSGQTCTTWQNIAGGGGTGNCNVAGNVGDLQKKAIGACSASSINDNGSVVNVGEPTNHNANVTNKGPNPYFDITNPAYGAVADNISGTASCAGTTTITLGGAYAFTNGEGVAIQGCGPTPALTTPPAPTVVTGNLIGLPVPNSQLTTATGSSTFTYWFVDRTLNGGLSAAGAQTTIANGLPLGMQSTAATSYSLTGHVLTITFSATPNVANGTHFSYDGMTNPTTGVVKSQVTGTTGTTVTATVANYCLTTCTGTGGIFTWENGNRVSRALQAAPVWQTYICGERPGDISGHILGAMNPVLVNYTGSGYSDYEFGSANTTTVFTWSDFGATQSNPTPFSGFGTFPYYVTDSICGNVSVTPESLFTSIVSGAGTTSLVVANAASQVVSGQTIQSDAGAGIQAADNAAFNGPSNIRGSITIPDVSETTTGRFIVHRPLLLKSLVYVVGNILTGETVTVKGALVGVKSNAANPQFAWLGTSYINGNQGAYPTVIQDSDQNYIGSIDLQVNATNASKVLLMARNQNETLDQVSFASGGGTNDYCGMAMEVPPAAFNFRLKDVTYIGGPNQVGNSSWCPSIFFYNVAAGASIAHLSIEGDSYISPRGIYIDGTGWPLSTMNFDNFYSQGPIFPLLSVFNVAAPQITFSKCTQLADTSAAQIIDIENVGGPGSLSNIYTCGLANTASGNVLPFTGTQGGVPSIADFPNLPGQVLPTPFLQPGTTGRTTLGQTWSAYETLVPQNAIPIPPVGMFNYGLLNADTFPSFKDSSSNKYFLATWLSTVGISNNDCVKFAVSGGIATLGDSGGPCSSGNFISNNLMTTLGDMIYENATPTPTRLPGPTSPNGVPQFLTNTPSGGAAQAEAWGLGGVPVNNNAETTCATQTLNVLDRATAIFCSGGTTSTFTLPVHTTSGFGLNYPFMVYNGNSGNMTLTPTTDTIDRGTLLPAWAAYLYNNSAGNWQSNQFPAYAAFGATCGDATHALNWSTTTGFGCQSISASAITVQTNTVNNTSQTTLNLLNSAAFNGLTFTFTNTAAGNVQGGFSGTLGNGGLTNSTIPINGTTCTLGTACTPPPDNCGFVDLTNSTVIALQTICTAPAAGHYLITYYMDVNSSCPTGADTWALLFQWVDASGTTRSLQTGNLNVTTSQLASSYLEGTFSVWVGSGNVTVTPQHLGACASGTSSYDFHTTGTGKLR